MGTRTANAWGIFGRAQAEAGARAAGPRAGAWTTGGRMGHTDDRRAARTRHYGTKEAKSETWHYTRAEAHAEARLRSQWLLTSSRLIVSEQRIDSEGI